MKICKDKIEIKARKEVDEIPLAFLCFPYTTDMEFRGKESSYYHQYGLKARSAQGYPPGQFRS